MYHLGNLPKGGVGRSYSGARNRGLTHYYTRRPCHRGHLALRNISNGSCLECHRLDEAERRTKRKEPAND